MLDPPDEKTIENDDALDVWHENEIRKRKQERKKLNEQKGIGHTRRNGNKGKKSMGTESYTFERY